MSSRSSVGGVASVKMWLPRRCGGSNPPTSLEHDQSVIRVPIISSHSKYHETMEIINSVIKVSHTLTLTTLSCDNFWGSEALRGAQQLGCIAEVEISSHGKIVLGWSEDLGYEQPLRLVQTTVESSQSANEVCLKTWVFKSYSIRPLI